MDVPSYYLNIRQEVAIQDAKIRHLLATHSFLISENPPPTCDERHANFSAVQHIILDCMKYIRNNLAIPPSIEEALNEKNIHKIITFLTKTYLINKC